MTKTLTQTITFTDATAKELYALYMTSKKHSEATGAPAEMSKKVGEKWTAHKGELRGTNLLVKANTLVVQTWRCKGWKSDSILTLSFADSDDGCVVSMVHALVPEDRAAEVKKGWTKMYWGPFKKYLKAQAGA